MDAFSTVHVNSGECKRQRRKGSAKDEGEKEE